MQALVSAIQGIVAGDGRLCVRVWAKDNGGMGSFYRSQHEMIFVSKAASVAAWRSTKYVDIAMRRWQNLTGERATRIPTGAAFDDVTPKETSNA